MMVSKSVSEPSRSIQRSAGLPATLMSSTRKASSLSSAVRVSTSAGSCSAVNRGRSHPVNCRAASFSASTVVFGKPSILTRMLMTGRLLAVGLAVEDAASGGFDELEGRVLDDEELVVVEVVAGVEVEDGVA